MDQKKVKTIGEAIALLRSMIDEATALYADAVKLERDADRMISIALDLGEKDSAESFRENRTASRMTALKARLAIEENQVNVAILEKIAAEKGMDWQGVQPA